MRPEFVFSHELVNPTSVRISFLSSLTTKKGFEKHSKFIVSSPKVVLEAINAVPNCVSDIYLSPDAHYFDALVESASKSGIHKHISTDQILSRIDKNSQGAIAVIKDFVLDGGNPAGGEGTAVGTVASVSSGGSGVGTAVGMGMGGSGGSGSSEGGSGAYSLFVVCDNISDPQNAGSIIRISDALGVQKVYFTKGSVFIKGAKVARASAGSLFHVPVDYGSDFEDIVGELRAKGVFVVASVVRGAKYDIDYLVNQAKLKDSHCRGVAIVMGNESLGIDADDAALCDATVTIPMLGRAESLNVSTAATILLWELRRQLK
jgi:TrmH family RNA methyltransferase